MFFFSSFILLIIIYYLQYIEPSVSCTCSQWFSFPILVFIRFLQLHVLGSSKYHIWKSKKYHLGVSLCQLTFQLTLSHPWYFYVHLVPTPSHLLVTLLANGCSNISFYIHLIHLILPGLHLLLQMGIGFYKSCVILAMQVSRSAFIRFWFMYSTSSQPNNFQAEQAQLSASQPFPMSQVPQPLMAILWAHFSFYVFPVLVWAKLGALFCIFSLFIRGEWSFPSYTSNISNTVCC